MVFVQRGDVLTATLPRLKRNLEYTDLGIAKLHFQVGAEAAGVVGTWEEGAPAAFVRA